MAGKQRHAAEDALVFADQFIKVRHRCVDRADRDERPLPCPARGTRADPPFMFSRARSAADGAEIEAAVFLARVDWTSFKPHRAVNEASSLSTLTKYPYDRRFIASTSS